MQRTFLGPRPVVAAIDVDDVDQMTAALADCLDIDCVPLERKLLKGQWTIVRAGSIVARLGWENIAMVRRVRAINGRWAFHVPLTEPSRARWNGNAIRDGEVIVSPPGAESYAFGAGRAESAIVIVDAATAATMMVAAPRGAPESSRVSYPIRPTQMDVRRLQRQLMDLRHLAAHAPTPDTVIRAACRVSGLLGACVRSAVPGQAVTRASCSAHRIVERSEALFQQRMGEPLTMAQLSTTAGVSERTLRNAFYQVYATSPKRYLRIRQLHHVRNALRAARPGAVTVTDVATRHGFCELGRFAGEYKTWFGELPSATLRRALGSSPAPVAVLDPVADQRKRELSWTA